MADPNSDLLLLARRLKRVPTPTWLTLQWAEAARVDTPLPAASVAESAAWSAAESAASAARITLADCLRRHFPRAPRLGGRR